MKKNHWGYTVDSEIPITGVVNNNDESVEYLYDEFYASGVDLEIENYIEELKAQGKNEEEIEEELEHYESTSPYMLLGFIKGDDGKYDIDPKAMFAAIWNELTIQVVKSPIVERCALCSPCFPGQGDLGTPGEFLTFAPEKG